MAEEVGVPRRDHRQRATGFGQSPYWDPTNRNKRLSDECEEDHKTEDEPRASFMGAVKRYRASRHVRPSGELPLWEIAALWQHYILHRLCLR